MILYIILNNCKNTDIINLLFFCPNTYKPINNNTKTP